MKKHFFLKVLAIVVMSLMSVLIRGSTNPTQASDLSLSVTTIEAGMAFSQDSQNFMINAIEKKGLVADQIEVTSYFPITFGEYSLAMTGQYFPFCLVNTEVRFITSSNNLVTITDSRSILALEVVFKIKPYLLSSRVNNTICARSCSDRDLPTAERMVLTKKPIINLAENSGPSVIAG